LIPSGLNLSWAQVSSLVAKLPLDSADYWCQEDSRKPACCNGLCTDCAGMFEAL